MLANPQLAVAANLPAKTPLVKDTIASPNNTAPYFKMGCIAELEAACTSFTIFAIKNGIKHSQNASNVINIGVISDAFLYCRTLCNRVFNIPIYSFLPPNESFFPLCNAVLLPTFVKRNKLIIFSNLRKVNRFKEKTTPFTKISFFLLKKCLFFCICLFLRKKSGAFYSFRSFLQVKYII